MNEKIVDQELSLDDALSLTASDLSNTPADQVMSFEYRDEFYRKPIAQNILKILESDIDVSPLVIDGGWGIGKSEFCLKLIHLIRNEHIDWQLTYIDAFKSDHSDESLMVLVAAVSKLVQQEDTKAKFIKSALPVLRVATKIGLKAVVGRVLKQNTEEVATEFQDAIKEASDSIIDTTLEKMVKDFEEMQNGIIGLKRMLTELASSKPIMIFIDELDRCRPDYAISFIENVKHIFDVPNVKIVFVCNMKQLVAAINHRYGQKVEASLYLEKFFKVKVPLTTSRGRDVTRRHHHAISHFSNLLTERKIPEAPFGDLFEATTVINRVIARNNVSLRDIEKLVLNLSLFRVLTNTFGYDAHTSHGDAIIIFLAVYIFTFRSDIANDLLLGKAAAQRMVELFTDAEDSRLDDHEQNELFSIAILLFREEGLKVADYMKNHRMVTQIGSNPAIEYARGKRHRIFVNVIETLSFHPLH